MRVEFKSRAAVPRRSSRAVKAPTPLKTPDGEKSIALPFVPITFRRVIRSG